MKTSPKFSQKLTMCVISILLLSGCKTMAERCVDMCVKQGKTMESFHWENRTTAVCKCKEKACE